MPVPVPVPGPLAPGAFGIMLERADLFACPPRRFALGGSSIAGLDRELAFVHACFHSALGDWRRRRRQCALTRGGRYGWPVSERLRLLSLIKGLGSGGAEQLLLSAARVRDRQAFDEEIAYLIQGEPTLLPRLEEIGVPIHDLRGTREQDFRWANRLRRLVIDRRYDVVHVHSPYVAGLARLAVRSIPRARRPRLVSSEHSLWPSHSPATRVLNAATFPLGDAWFAVSNEVRTSIPRILRGRVEVLAHGVVLDDMNALVAGRDAVRSELGLSSDEVAVVTVANNRWQKGYPDLLEAARRMRVDGVRARFFVIGKDTLDDEIVALRDSLGLAGYVTLLGYRSDATRIAAACDLFALASLYEGLPVAIMEALAVGLPVVATGVGGIPEAVRDGVEGLIVPAKRPDLLADAIGSLVRDTDRRIAMKKAATERGREYDIEFAVRRLEDVYRDLCVFPRE